MPGTGRGPARHRRAEEHLLFAAVAREQQREGAVHQRAHGELVPPREGVDGARVGLRTARSTARRSAPRRALAG